MKKIICTLCGGDKIEKQGDSFVCRDCGCRYSVEEARVLLTEVDEPSSHDASTFDGGRNREYASTFEETARGRGDTKTQQDSEHADGSGMSDLEKYEAVKKASWKKQLPLLLMTWAGIIVSIACFIAGLVNGNTMLVWLGVIVFAVNGAGFFLFGWISLKSKKSRYLDTHCPYCGGAYEGSDYGYNEVKSKVVNGMGANSLKVTTDYTYEIACPECGKIQRGKESYTSDNAGDNLAKLTKMLDGIVGPEVPFDSKMVAAPKKAVFRNWAIFVNYTILLVVLACVFSFLGGLPSGSDTQDYYGKYVLGLSWVEFKSDGTATFYNGRNSKDYEYRYYSESEYEIAFGEPTEYPVLAIDVGSGKFATYTLRKSGDYFTVVSTEGDVYYDSDMIENVIDPKDYYGEYYSSDSIYIKVSDGKIKIGTSAANEMTLDYQYYTAEAATAKTGVKYSSAVLLSFEGKTEYRAFELIKGYGGIYMIEYDDNDFYRFE